MADWGKIRSRDCGSAAASLINPVHAKPTRNFAKDQRKTLAEQQRRNREKKVDSAVADPAPFKMKQFDGVGSRLAKGTERPDKTACSYMKKGDGRCMLLPEEEQEHQPRARIAERPAVPLVAAMAPKLAHEARNHILQNRAQAEQAGLVRRAKLEEEGLESRIKKNFGKVPTYLKAIKQNLADEKREEEALKHKEDIPPGYRLLAEDERQDMLTSLNAKLKEANDRFRKLPLQITTDRHAREQKDLLDKMQELEKAVELFSKPKVMLEV